MKLKYTKEQARAYLSQFADMKFVGASMTEVVYTHQKCGTFATERIQMMIDRLRPATREALYHEVLIQDDLVETIAACDISMDRVNAMPSRLPYEKPCMFLGMDDGTHILGDGNHRVKRLLLDGATHVPAYLIPWDVVQKFRVYTLVRRRGKAKWERLPPEVDLAIMEGDFFHHLWT